MTHFEQPKRFKQHKTRSLNFIKIIPSLDDICGIKSTGSSKIVILVYGAKEVLS